MSEEATITLQLKKETKAKLEALARSTQRDEGVLVAEAIDAYVELEVGAGRCGLVEISDAVALAEKIHASPALRFAGIQAYQGSAQHLRSRAERKAQGGIVSLKPGEERRYLLRLTPVAGAEALAAVERRAEA